MTKKNPEVDAYLSHGCGRCSLGGTPQCRVHDWQQELKLLRRIALACGLTEERKWGVPCYMFRKHNIVLVSALKEYCALSFFKGVLLKDPEGILTAPGENSQSTRQLRFTGRDEIVAREAVIMAYIHEAVAVEQSGRKVTRKRIDEHEVPEEFRERLDANPALKAAFKALTPGRQRGYLLHIAGAKQSKTRLSRIDKCVPQILQGKGMHDR